MRYARNMRVLKPREKGDVMASFGFDQRQLAAALEQVEFTQKAVGLAIDEAAIRGAALMGERLMHTELQVFTILVYNEGYYSLYVTACNSNYPPLVSKFTPSFGVKLLRRDYAELASLPRTTTATATIIPLGDNPEMLIGARLTLAV